MVTIPKTCMQTILAKAEDCIVSDLFVSVYVITHLSYRFMTSNNLLSFVQWRQTFWGYMIKRLSAYGGCLGEERR